MNSKHWENSYRRAVENIQAPAQLDNAVLENIRAVKPVRMPRRQRQGNRLLSKAASGFSALAMAIVLLHPAQYIGAAPGQIAAPDTGISQSSNSGLQRYKPKPAAVKPALDQWHRLRTEVEAGNYMQLCAQWRRQDRGEITEKLPPDLATRARQHCRILP